MYVLPFAALLAVYAVYLLYRRWKELSKTATEEEKLWAKEGTIFAIGLGIIGFLSAHFLIVEDILHLSIKIGSGTSAFSALRVIMLIIYVVNLLPGAVLGELAYSRIKKRSFRPRNVLIFAIIFGEGILTMMALLTLFDLFLPNISVLIQFPLIAIIGSISTGIVIATSKIKRVSEFMKKAFE
jgi:hypothetical protein